jgi:hypothetical protein
MRDFLPGVVSLLELLAVLEGGEEVASGVKVLGNQFIRGKQALGVTRRVEACIRRSRWCVGWWEFSARLFK